MFVITVLISVLFLTENIKTIEQDEEILKSKKL